MTRSIRPNRRHFLKQTAGAGLVAGVGPLLASCGGSDGDAGSAATVPLTETRSYYFDLSNAHPDTDFFLVSGAKHHPLTSASAAHVASAKAGNPALQSLSSQSITHVGESLVLPARLQMCFVKGVPRGSRRKPGEWEMHSMFYHVPATASAQAAQRATVSCGKDLLAAQRLAYHACLRDAEVAAAGVTGGTVGTGVVSQNLAFVVPSNSLCAGPEYDNYKDYFDHAMALVSHHPEIGSFDADALSYVQQAIICADENLQDLAASLYEQGPATTNPNSGWATLVEYNDPDTGLPKLGSNGDKLYFVQHSAATLAATGVVIKSVLPKIKNDLTLGADITGLSKTEINPSLKGKLWVTKNGTTARPPTAQAVALSPVRSALNTLVLADSGSGPTWAARDLSSGNGFRVSNITGVGRTVTFTVENWYLRYLGLYIRFLDGNGQPIERSTLSADIQQQFINPLGSTYDCFLSIVNQELAILGIPIRQDEQTFSVNIPESAASIQILAGGLGHGTKSYPTTIAPGAVMTVVLDIAIPGVFLAMSAVSGYSSLSTKLAGSTKLLISASQILVLGLSDALIAGVYSDPAVFKNLAFPLLASLRNVPFLYAEIQASMAAGEAEGAAEDCIPFGIGLALQAIMALGLAAQIAETSAEIANAPWTFATQVDATHNLTVTINHDPADTAGFPSTATYYSLRAVCDNGSPAESGPIQMSATTRTDPLSYTFNHLPAGGKVTVTVAFYSANDWLAGAGSTGAIENTTDAASITITENEVPLTTTTQYSHKQKLGLDGAGNHIWVAGAAPPAVPVNCDNVAGSLCILQSIAVSESFGSVGYVWKSYSAGVRSFATDAAGQLFQFANISFTQDPQSGWMHSGGGFSLPPRVAYSRSSPTSQSFYIDTSKEQAVVRRINMTAVGVPPTFDSPVSKLAVGRFNFASDAFLIHTSGKLISINAALGKLEVLVPASIPVDDDSAPVAQAYIGPGTRQGLLNGPVCAVVAPNGAILVLEQGGNRIQAFDTGANPTKYFAGSRTMALKPQPGGVQYLDMAIEFAGYIYVLSVNANTAVYSMDIYTPAGTLLATTSGMNASKLAIDLFRNVYTLNFETIQPVGNLTEPSVSLWIPSTPITPKTS